MKIDREQKTEVTLQELIEKYKDYENSEHFIRCAFASLYFRRHRTIVTTIEEYIGNKFTYNCRLQNVKYVIKHMENMVHLTLDKEEYELYALLMSKLTSLKIILHKMEKEIYYQYCKENNLTNVNHG